MKHLDEMTLVTTLVEKGSLSAAAKALQTSVSTVSRHLFSLEKRLNTRLLTRTTRKLVPTETGRLYYEHARRILEEIRDMETLLDIRNAVPSGHIRISLPTLFGHAHIFPLLTRFSALYPAVELDIQFLDREISLIGEEIDIAVYIGPLRESSLIARPLGEIRRVICASPGYLATRGSPDTPADLPAHSCIAYARLGDIPKWQFRIGGKPKNQPIHPRIRSNTLDTVITAALDGAGLACLPHWAIAGHLAEGRLKTVLSGYEPLPLPVNILYTHSKRLSPKTRVLVNFLINHIHFTS